MKPQDILPSQIWSEPSGAARRIELPAELLAGALTRVRLLCGLLAGMAVLYEVLDIATARGLLDAPISVVEPALRRRLLGFHAVALTALAISGVMYTYSRRHATEPLRVVRAAVFYQVAGALLISAGERLTPWLPGAGISVACLWIMTFPLIPSSPKKAAIAAYFAASMEPIGYLIGAIVRRQPPSHELLLFRFLTNYLAATFAFVSTTAMFRLAEAAESARRLGAYQLIERLGEGGMGEVWLARHKALVRPAAIKLMRAEVLGATSAEVRATQERFRREVQATAEMESPHTIEIYDFGATGDGRLYYVMELLRGLDLEEMVRRFGPLPAERVIHLLRQACASLAEAHEHGLIHRDIKPSNIHVCVLGLEHDYVKVLDFGLVKHERAQDTHVSLDGLLVGTPAYMSPEAANGDPIDSRADLYALGCVGFWMLTGRTVFGEKMPALMVADHARTPPDTPSKVSPLPISPELDAVILACLAKNPNGRPQTAMELMARLDQVPISEPWTEERARNFWLKNHPKALMHLSTDAKVLVDRT